jgi:hypothetical protein
MSDRGGSKSPDETETDPSSRGSGEIEIRKISSGVERRIDGHTPFDFPTRELVPQRVDAAKRLDVMPTPYTAFEVPKEALRDDDGHVEGEVDIDVKLSSRPPPTGLANLQINVPAFPPSSQPLLPVAPNVHSHVQLTPVEFSPVHLPVRPPSGPNIGVSPNAVSPNASSPGELWTPPTRTKRLVVIGLILAGAIVVLLGVLALAAYS